MGVFLLEGVTILNQRLGRFRTMMLGKSKELLETNQKILSTLEAQNEKLTKLEKEVGEIKVEKTSAVEGLIADLQNVTDAYQKGVEEIKLVRKDIENELNNFKIIKSKMFSKGIEEVQNQIQEEIRKLKIDATTYTDLLEELQETVKSTEKARKDTNTK